MKTLKRIVLILTVSTLIVSCNRGVNDQTEQAAQTPTVGAAETSPVVQNNEDTTANKLKPNFLLPKEDENYDWITEYFWGISDGRWIEDRSILGHTLDWVGDMTPRARFHKLEIPSESILYQVRLRSEMFYFLYQTEEEPDIFYPVGTAFGTNPFEIIFRNDYSNMRKLRAGILWNPSNRVGEQTDPDHPLVGVWGSLPSLYEYRLVDPENVLYYMEINKEIPFFAVREGTYLLRQIDKNIFETVSSFPDGQLRLEISERRILLRPLFTLPDEEGIVGLLEMNRGLAKISELTEEDLNPYNW
ncbi:MAG: hypothetical protein FWC97_06620 [Treponema sp.]|nr:hypothetical protein [Treponema sp.]